MAPNKSWISKKHCPLSFESRKGHFLFEKLERSKKWKSEKRRCLLSIKVCYKVLKLDNLTLQMCLLFIYLQIDVEYASCNSNLVDGMSKLTNIIKFFFFYPIFGAKNLGAKENRFSLLLSIFSSRKCPFLDLELRR